jgi:hypothetical protein
LLSIWERISACFAVGGVHRGLGVPILRLGRLRSPLKDTWPL